MSGEREAEGGERSTRGLTDQARGRDNAARAAAAVWRRAGHDRPYIWSLEQAKSDAAHRHAPDDVGDGWIGGQCRKQQRAKPEQHKAKPTEQAGGKTVRQAPANRR